MAGTRQVSGCAVLGAGVWLHVYRETLLYGVLLRDNPTDPRLTHPRLTHACDNPTDPRLTHPHLTHACDNPTDPRLTHSRLTHA